MSDANCEECKKRVNGGCEKHPTKICPIDGSVCDRKCGYAVHGTFKRVPLKIPATNYCFAPSKDIEKGLCVIFKEGEPKMLFSDIHKWQKEYEMPNDRREIEGVYIKVK